MAEHTDQEVKVTEPKRDRDYGAMASQASSKLWTATKRAASKTSDGFFEGLGMSLAVATVWGTYSAIMARMAPKTPVG